MANRGYNLCLLNYYLWNETGKLFENSSEMWSGDEYFVVYSPWKRSVRQIPPLYCLKWTSDNAGQRVLCFLDRQKEVGGGEKLRIEVEISFVNEGRDFTQCLLCIFLPQVIVSLFDAQIWQYYQQALCLTYCSLLFFVNIHGFSTLKKEEDNKRFFKLKYISKENREVSHRGAYC